jgi:uncharacterized membrane protein YgcG
MKTRIGQFPVWIISRHLFCLFVLLLLQIACLAQVHTGSNGSDGQLSPTANTTTTIDLNKHPDGVFQYTSVNIPNNVTVAFTPNANNTPVTWLVQGAVVIAGAVDVSGQSSGGPGGGAGGFPGQGTAPIGYRGGGLGGGNGGTSGAQWGGWRLVRDFR